MTPNLPDQTATAKAPFSYPNWYQQNKERLSAKKKALYANDPAYKAAALARSASRRGKQPPVDLGEYTVSFKDAATQVGVTIWSLREWRRKNYFPEPKHQVGKLYFSQAQVGLLTMLEAWFGLNGRRPSAAKRASLEDFVCMVHANWN
jgi:hypothetical protein